MIATPHFYASHDRVDAFLNRREDAYNSLKEAVHKESLSDVPQILTGSEVAFFDGISKAELIEDLTIQNTRVLLLEMPFAPWTSQNIHEVEVLVRDRGFNVLIAHLERFIWIPGNKKGIRSLLEIPVRIQINSEGLQDWRHRRYLLKMFRSGSAHVLGSDCHGAHHRVPDLLTGREIIKKKWRGTPAEDRPAGRSSFIWKLTDYSEQDRGKQYVKKDCDYHQLHIICSAGCGDGL